MVVWKPPSLPISAKKVNNNCRTTHFEITAPHNQCTAIKYSNESIWFVDFLHLSCAGLIITPSHRYTFKLLHQINTGWCHYLFRILSLFTPHFTLICMCGAWKNVGIQPFIQAFLSCLESKKEKSKKASRGTSVMDGCATSQEGCTGKALFIT